MAHDADPDLDAEGSEDSSELAEAEDLPGVGELPVAGEEGPEKRRFAVRNDVQLRLDVYLRSRLKSISRTKLQQLIDLGGVTVNERVPKASTLIRAGDVIDVILPPPAVRTIEPEPIPLDVLYEDDHLVVINKQAGLLVHPARGNLSGTLINGLAHRFKQQREAAGLEYQPRQTRGYRKEKRQDDAQVPGLSRVGAAEFRPGIIHRLDKNTTGCLVVAKDDATHWAVARQFEDRTTLKAYLAVVHGALDTAGGVIDEPLGKHPTIREAMAVRHDSRGKRSVTLFRVREQYRGYCLVELELKTGRTHQIRVHLSYLGHPIVGDILYGGEPVGAAELDAPPQPAGARRYLNYARDKIEGDRLEADAAANPATIIAHPALHAALLSFLHPKRQQMMTFTAALHEPLATLVRELRQRPGAGPVATEGYWIDLSKLAP